MIVNPNCESRKKRSSENIISINPTVDVPTTTVSPSPELLQQELSERLEIFLAGDGLINRKSKGVCCYRQAICWSLVSSTVFFLFVVVLGAFLFFSVTFFGHLVLYL